MDVGQDLMTVGKPSTELTSIATDHPGYLEKERRTAMINHRNRITSIAVAVSAALFLAGSGCEESEETKARKEAEQRQLAKQAEQRRLADKSQQELANKANAQVKALVRKAEAAWRANNSRLAQKELASAEKIPHATDLSPIRLLRAQMANAEVESLMVKATEAVEDGSMNTARLMIKRALAVPHADLDEVKKLEEQIANGTEPDRIRAMLIKISDEEFQQLQKNKKMPTQLVTGYDGLDRLTATLARDQIADVAPAREERRQKQLQQAERERAAAEAARKATEAARKVEEERKAREAEAARKVEEERKAREAEAAEAKHREERKKRIERGFSAWDGSHRGLTKVIKASMNDPKSYEHVETVYLDMGDHLVVTTTFRGKNAFGGVVPNWTKAKVDLDGKVLAIIGQGFGLSE
jgi:hypothetical protein